MLTCLFPLFVHSAYINPNLAFGSVFLIVSLIIYSNATQHVATAIERAVSS